MSEKKDVVIVGAGIIGLVTAYELAKRGASVTVVEEKKPGWAASHGNAGMIYPAAGMPMVNPHHMKAGIGWVLTRGGQSPLQFSMLEMLGLVGWGLRALGACNQKDFESGYAAFGDLGAAALDQFEEYKQQGIQYEEHPGGFLATFINAREFERQASGYKDSPAVEILTGAQIREREPTLSSAVVGAVQLTEGFTSVYPPDVCRAFVKKLTEMGVEIRTGVRIVSARHSGGRVLSLSAADGSSLEADEFVVAAGGWSGQIAKMIGSHTSITGGKGYAITIDDPDVKPSQTVFLTEYEAVVIPFDGKVRFTGFLELSGVNMKVLPRRIKALRNVMGRYLSRVPKGPTEEHWTGMRACTPDGLPAIGKLPGLDNAWLGSGHWHFGLTLAPPTAVMLAELMTTGTSTVNNKPFDPRRF